MNAIEFPSSRVENAAFRRMGGTGKENRAMTTNAATKRLRTLYCPHCHLSTPASFERCTHCCAVLCLGKQTRQVPTVRAKDRARRDESTCRKQLAVLARAKEKE